MSEALTLRLHSPLGGETIDVPCTMDSAGAITILAIPKNTLTNYAWLKLFSENGGEPTNIVVTIHDDSTVELGTGGAAMSGHILFDYPDGREPLARAASIAGDGTVTFPNVTFTGSGAPTFDASWTVNATTIAVRFSEKVQATDFTAGVTIKKNTVAQTITSGTRQANHAIVYYVVDTPFDANDALTWEYAAAGGNIADETDGTVLENVTAKTVTNNVPAVPPEFSAAEIGTVLDTTVAVTFTEKVSAAGNDYSTGVTIKVNTVAAVIASGTRQADHHIVYYVIPAVDADDVVTWEYDDTTGLIVNEDDGGVMATTTAQAVTNNVAPVPPTFVSAEVGTVNATTVVATFSVNLKAAGDDFTTGITIKKGGVGQAISAGVRQANHAIIYYTIPAIVNGDVVTIEYDDTTGLIQNEADSAPMATFAAQAVTNNVP